MNPLDDDHCYSALLARGLRREFGDGVSITRDRAPDGEWALHSARTCKAQARGLGKQNKSFAACLRAT